MFLCQGYIKVQFFPIPNVRSWNSIRTNINCVYTINLLEICILIRIINTIYEHMSVGTANFYSFELIKKRQSSPIWSIQRCIAV